MSDDLQLQLLRTAELARLLGISEQRLRHWRMLGEGPPFLKLTARSVAYRRQDVTAWLESRQTKRSAPAA